jgi:hypothetical protein
MVASGAVPLAEGYKAIDIDAITLLLGMMIIVARCAAGRADRPRSANDLSGRRKATAGYAAGAASSSMNAAPAC